MAYKQRTGMAAATHSILTDDPDFLRVLVERVVQAVLEVEAAGWAFEREIDTGAGVAILEAFVR